MCHETCNLVYEAIVPITAVLGHDLTDKALKKAFSIGIVVGALPDNRPYNERGGAGQSGYRPRVSMGGGGVRGMGMGMAMGGMRGGGGGGRGRGGQTTNQPREESYWYTFRFADK